MKTLALLFTACMVTLTQSPPPPTGPTSLTSATAQAQPASRTTQPSSPLIAAGVIRDVDPEAAGRPGRFLSIPLTIDPQGTALAAYQIEITARRGTFKVVGVGTPVRPVDERGGSVFPGTDPPRYDRDAAAAGPIDRLIVADFSLKPAQQLPTAVVTVATVEVYVEDLNFSADDLILTLQAAADPQGVPIPNATVRSAPLPGADR